MKLDENVVLNIEPEKYETHESVKLLVVILDIVENLIIHEIKQYLICYEYRKKMILVKRLHQKYVLQGSIQY